MKRFYIEFKGDCKDGGEWRPTIMIEARDGFDTQEEAQSFIDVRKGAYCIYRVVEREEG